MLLCLSTIVAATSNSTASFIFDIKQSPKEDNVVLLNTTKTEWVTMTEDEQIAWARVMVANYDKETKRIKRGFGPWEAQDTWDERGKGNLVVLGKQVADLVSSIVNETKIIVSEIANETAIIIDEIEHPIRFLSKSKVGITIMVIVSFCVLAVILISVGPICKALMFVLLCLWKPFRFLVNSTCCIYCWSITPIRKLRNTYIEAQKEKEAMESLRVYTHDGEALELLQRSYSKVFTDDHGAYMLASDNHRVYFDAATAVEDILKSKTLAPDTRETLGGKHKETMLVNSKLYKTGKLPDFQGQFDVDNKIVGHFARIRFQDRDCLLTAYHVLDYNKTALIRLRKGDKLIDLNTIDAHVLVASPTNHLDYVIMQIPDFVFGALGIKLGHYSTRVMPREAVCIHQLYEGKPCVSTAAVKLFEKKPWHIAYSASTIVGTSGAPILDTRGTIIGVHLEHDAETCLNVGVVPPIFRNSRKESPTNEDLMQHQRRMVWEDDEYDEKYDDQEYDSDEEGDRYKYAAQEELEERYLNFARNKGGKNWQEDFDKIDYQALLDMEQDAADEIKYGEGENTIEGFQLIRLAQRKRASYNLKQGNRFGKETTSAKESPWTCKRCGCLHWKLQHNCSKCQLSFEPAANRKEVKEFVDLQIKALHDGKNVLPTVVQDIIAKELRKISGFKEICAMVASSLRAGKMNVYNMTEIQNVVRHTVYNYDMANERWHITYLGDHGENVRVPIEAKTLHHFQQGGEKTAAQIGWKANCEGLSGCTESESHPMGRDSSKYDCEVLVRATQEDTPVAPQKDRVRLMGTPVLEAYTKGNFVKIDPETHKVKVNEKKVASVALIDFEVVKSPSNHPHGLQTTHQPKDAVRKPRVQKPTVAPLEELGNTNLYKEEMAKPLSKVEKECFQQMEGLPTISEEKEPEETFVLFRSKSARRRFNKKQKDLRSKDPRKETLVTFVDPKQEDPLNSNAPATTGASVTTGQIQNLSQTKVSASVSPSASSTHALKTKQAKSGKPSVKSSQNITSTTGQSVQQKQRK